MDLLNFEGSYDEPSYLLMFEITIPVFNEEKKLRSNILTLNAFILKELPEYKDWNIVIADNGSTDMTQSIGQELAIENTRVKYIRLNEKGVGRALKASWLSSQAEIIGYMDLDLATDLRHLPEVLQALKNGYDIVYGTRLHPTSHVLGRTLKREITSRAFNYIMRQYLKVHCSDGMCGFKFMNRNIVRLLYDAGARSDGWFFSTELIVVSEWLKLKIFELPITWTDSTESKVSIVPVTLQYLKSMQAIKERLNRQQKQN